MTDLVTWVPYFRLVEQMSRFQIDLIWQAHLAGAKTMKTLVGMSSSFSVLGTQCRVRTERAQCLAWACDPLPSNLHLTSVETDVALSHRKSRAAIGSQLQFWTGV